MPKASSNPTQRPRPKERSTPGEPRSRREAVERLLAFAVAGFAAVAVLGFAATMLHVALREGVDLFSGVAWQYAFWLPLVALPMMIVCLVALVIVTASGKAGRR